MATFTIDTAYTLADVLKSYDPEKKLHHLIDAFSDKRPILEEGYWQEANGETSHEMLQIVSRPSGAFLRIDEGYAKEGVQTKPVKEQLAMIGSRFEIDKRLLEIQRDPIAWRSQRAQAHIRGMLQAWNRQFWIGADGNHSVANQYNTGGDSEKVNGILTRYTPSDTSDHAAAVTAGTEDDNQKNLSGSSNLYPVVVIKWGMEDVSLLYPKFGKNTFEEEDRGLVDLLDANNLPYPGYRSYFKFRYGISVGQARSVQRLYNVDATAIKSSATFEEALIEVLNNMNGTDRCAIYCGRQVMTGIQQRINSKTNVMFSTENVWGRMLPTFLGVPIVRDDSLSIAETAVAA